MFLAALDSGKSEVVTGILQFTFIIYLELFLFNLHVL